MGATNVITCNFYGSEFGAYGPFSANLIVEQTANYKQLSCHLYLALWPVYIVVSSKMEMHHVRQCLVRFTYD
jgi:hypothetical protein